MKTLNSKMEPVMVLAPALSMYRSKGWINRFETQLDKLERQRFSNCAHYEEFTEFRYDGFYYAVFDDRVKYRSLSETRFYEIHKKEFTNVNYFAETVG